MGILDKILRAGEGKTLRTLEGISRQVNAIEEDFVAMSDEELAKTPTVVHVPTAVATLGVIYSLPMVKELHLTGPLLADIFLGKVKTWNEVTKDKAVPALPI